ncbi:MAG TPA: cyclic nucleotide-binding domain-containing protein [Euzebyales bacterium]
MSRTARLLGVRSGDVAVTQWLVALFAATQAGHGLGSNTGDALLFVRYGVASLPPMIALSGVTVMVVTVAYAAAMSRVGLPRLLPPVAWGLACALLVERAAVATDRPVVYAAIWLTEQVVVLLTFTMMWGAAGEACDTRQAKRLFPLLASAGIAGGFLGNLLTGPLAALLGTANVLIVHALLLVAVGLLLRAVARRFFTSPRTSSSGALDELRAGLRATRGSRLFRLTSVAAFALSVLFFLVVVPFAEVVTDSFGSDAQVAGFLGYFSALATAASLLVSLLLTNRLLRVVGVVGAVLVVPVLYGIGFALWAVSFTLVTAALVRAMQWVAVNAIGGTAWQGLFNVVRPPVRGQVMAFVTAVPTQLGVTASGVALTLGIADLPIQWLSLIGALTAIATTVVAVRMRPAYVTDLLAALRRGIVDVFDVAARSPAPPVPGRDARLALRAAVSDDQVARRRRAVQLVGILDDPPVELLLHAATDEDPQVRATAVALLGDIDDPQAVEATTAAFTDDDARVRRAAVGAVRHGPHGGGVISAALCDPDPLVRAAAAAAERGDAGLQVIAELLGSPDEQHLVAALDVATAWPDAAALPAIDDLTADSRPSVRLPAATALAARGVGALATILPLLGDDDPRVREGVADLLRGHRSCTAELLTILRDGSAAAQAAAVRALRGEPAAHGAIVQWAIQRAERAEAIRGYRAELPSIITTPAPSRDYLDRVLELRAWQALRGVLLALESLAGGTTAHLLTRGVRAGDPQVRAQAIEAIDSLGDRPLTRHVLPLLEDDPDPVSPAGNVLTWDILDDPDVWLRALAVRAAVDHVDALRSLVSEHARRDGAALVADALRGDEEVVVTQHDRSRGLIDTILALQQVPMFSDLPPEDLQHVAGHCAERVYGPDETIYHQGDTGDEMFILTDGRVRISRQDDGTRTLVRTYGPGDHVGELSLLRGRPRVADVIADSDGAEGLALDADAFRAIIEGRPEVAIAMLATLAERLGTA